MACNVRAVQKISNDGSAALILAVKDRASRVNLKKKHDSNEVGREQSLKSMQDKLNEPEHQVHELDHIQGTIHELESRLDKFAEALKLSDERVPSLTCRISTQSKQLISKDNKGQSGNNIILAIEKQVADSAGELDRFEEHHAIGKTLSKRARTATAFQKTASQQHIFSYVNVREKIGAENVFADLAFQKYCVGRRI